MAHIPLPWEQDVETYLRQFFRGLSPATVFCPLEGESKTVHEARLHLSGALFWDPNWTAREGAPLVEVALEHLNDPLGRGRPCRREWGLDDARFNGIGGVICIWVEFRGKPPISVTGGQVIFEARGDKKGIPEEKWRELLLKSIFAKMSYETVLSSTSVVGKILEMREDVQLGEVQSLRRPFWEEVEFIKAQTVDGEWAPIGVATPYQRGRHRAVVFVVLGEQAPLVYGEARSKATWQEKAVVEALCNQSAVRKAALNKKVPVIDERQLQSVLDMKEGLVLEYHIVNWTPDYTMPSCARLDEYYRRVRRKGPSRLSVLVDDLVQVYAIPCLRDLFGQDLTCTYQPGPRDFTLVLYPRDHPVIEMVPHAVARVQQVAQPVGLPVVRKEFGINVLGQPGRLMLDVAVRMGDPRETLPDLADFLVEWPKLELSARQAMLRHLQDLMVILLDRVIRRV